MECDTCSEHSGIDARITSLEKDNDHQWKEIGKMDERQRFMEKRFTQILITLIVVLLGVVANYLKT